MLINPDRQKVTVTELRQRMNLFNDTLVIPCGCEFRFPEDELRKIQKKYDLGSLHFRLCPDFIIIPPNGDTYYVEAKQQCDFVEALQLFFNRQMAQFGVVVKYSFPNKTIPCWQIPLNHITVPEIHKEVFKTRILPQIQLNYPLVQVSYIGVVNGSGDPYVSLNGVLN